MAIEYVGSNSVGEPVTPGARTTATTASALGFYGVAGVARPTSYTTGADGSTRTNATQTATTIGISTAGVLSLGTTGLGQNPIWGFDSSATATTVLVKINNLADDMQNTKELLNSLINDLKVWGLSG